MIVNQYCTKVKTLCEKITMLDPKNSITNTRMRRIIARGLKSSLNNLVIVIRGQATQLTLIEFENVLANQEARNNQNFFVKDEDTTLFRNKMPNKTVRKLMIQVINLEKQSKMLGDSKKDNKEEASIKRSSRML